MTKKVVNIDDYRNTSNEEEPNRLQRIRDSLDRINILMAEIQKGMEDEQSD